MMPVFALTTRGLEDLTGAELAALSGAVLTGTAYRRVLATCRSLAPLSALRTADDAYFALAQWDAVGHTRDMLAVLREAAAALDVPAAVEALRAVRSIPDSPAFSVTASFVGRRNYSVEEIKEAVSGGIADARAWTYTADDRAASVNVRVFIEGQTALVGLRVAAAPLHERPYRVAERAGALKPPVAAAMLRLAAVAAGQTVLDPCCGTGTILLEAAAVGAVPAGGDLDAQAVQAARANMRAAGAHFRVDQWDARRLSLPDHSIDAVVSNLPWGRQVMVDDVLADLYDEIAYEIERVLRPGGRAALLTTSPDLLRFKALTPAARREISLFGQTPQICLFDKPE